MSTMHRVTTLYNRPRWRTPTFYVDSRDAVNDGTGKVLSVADRVNGWSFAADVSGNRPSIDTALIGTQLILFPNVTPTQNLRCDVTTAFGGANTLASMVLRIRRTVDQSSQGMAVCSTTLSDAWGLGMSSTTSVRVVRQGTIVTTGNGTFDKATTLSLNTWYTIGFSYSPTSITFYRNGVSIGTSTSGNVTMATIDRIVLGNNSGSTARLCGYYAAWKGWAGVAISAAQHLAEHTQLAAWAA